MADFGFQSRFKAGAVDQCWNYVLLLVVHLERTKSKNFCAERELGAPSSEPHQRSIMFLSQSLCFCLIAFGGLMAGVVDCLCLVLVGFARRLCHAAVLGCCCLHALFVVVFFLSCFIFLFDRVCNLSLYPLFLP
jgi:hypothetical protein